MLTWRKGVTQLKVGRRAIAATAAALLLAAQLVAAAHVHPWAYAKAFSSGAQAGANDAACPLCILHAHAPLNTTSTPVLVKPLASEHFVAVTMRSRLPSASKPQLFGRAPPASI